MKSKLHSSIHHHAKAVCHLRKVDHVLGAVIKQLPPLEIHKRRSNYFRALAQSLIGQQLSVKAANTIRRRFQALFPGRVFPRPQDVLAMPNNKIRAAGLSHAKISYIKNIAQAVVDGELKLNKLFRRENEQIIVELVKIKGIGRWTAEMFLMFSLNRPDVFSHGDLGLRNAIQRLYQFKQPPTEKQIEKIVAKWSPYKTIACRYLLRSLDNEN